MNDVNQNPLTGDPPKDFELVVPEALDHKRIDVVLATLLPDFSRTQIGGWIKEGRVSVEGTPKTKAKERVSTAQTIHLTVPYEKVLDHAPEPMDLEIVYRDEEILVINKPAGLTVHPGAGQSAGTLLNGLLHFDQQLSALPRAGIVHRLDKLTSGLMVIGRTIDSYNRLVEMIGQRIVTRQYLALVSGVPITHFSIDKPIGRHSKVRHKMCIDHQHGRPSKTHFRVVKKFRYHALLKATLESGRTHQIRVHLTDFGCPIIGDKVYGRGAILGKNMEAENIEFLQQFPRQALHACHLTFPHPKTGAPLMFIQPMPADMQSLARVLRADKKNSA